jgi:DNA-binding beta-propeller fold protein YncE
MIGRMLGAGAILIGCLAAMVLETSCGKDTLPPEDPGCMIEPSSLDFGRKLTFPGDPADTINVDLNVQSLVLINSKGGTSDLSGDVSFSLDTQIDHPPRIELLPEGRDTHFVLPARTSEIFHFRVIYDATTSPGDLQGRFSFGTDCADVPFTLDLTVAGEPRPTFITEWGEEGSEIGQFQSPSCLAFGESHTLYVADLSNSRVQLLDRAGNVVDVWGEWDEHDMDDGLTHFHLPTGLAVGPTGDVYVADTEPEHGRKRITAFTHDGVFIKRWGPNRLEGSLFVQPWHLAVAKDGTIYSVDAGAKVVRAFVLDQSTQGYQTVAEWGGSEVFGLPYGIALDGSGHVFVSDQSRNRIHRFDREGNEQLSWGGTGSEIGEFKGPLGMTVDEAGALYVTDAGNHRVQKFTADGTFITTWGVYGDEPGQFDKPDDVKVADDGMIYVLDQVRNKILRFQPGESGS